MDIISSDDAYSNMEADEDDDLDSRDPSVELRRTLAEIRKKNAKKSDEKLLNIIQEKDVEEETNCSDTKSVGMESSNDVNSNGLLSLDGIFGIVQQNNDLFEVMNDRNDDENDAYKFVCEKSQGCVVQSTKRAYYAHQKLHSKLTEGFLN